MLKKNHLIFSKNKKNDQIFFTNNIILLILVTGVLLIESNVWINKQLWLKSRDDRICKFLNYIV